jgi:hypothetical protein
MLYVRYIQRQNIRMHKRTQIVLITLHFMNFLLRQVHYLESTIKYIWIYKVLFTPTYALSHTTMY